MPYENLRVMRDCFFPSTVGLGLGKNSPFKQAVDLRLNHLKEAGIVSFPRPPPPVCLKKEDQLCSILSLKIPEKIDKIKDDGFKMAGHIYTSRSGEPKTAGDMLELGEMQGVFQLFLAIVGATIMVRLASLCSRIPQKLL